MMRSSPHALLSILYLMRAATLPYSYFSCAMPAAIFDDALFKTTARPLPLAGDITHYSHDFGHYFMTCRGQAAGFYDAAHGAFHFITSICISPLHFAGAAMLVEFSQTPDRMTHMFILRRSRALGGYFAHAAYKAYKHAYY